MREIIKDGVILSRLINSNEITDGLNFFSKDDEFVQVGSWNYSEGKELQKHIHNVVERKITRTQEVLYIISGSIEASIYDLNEVFVDKLVASRGDVLILLSSGHGYRILENETKVLEIKNGPYLGAEIDRKRF